MKHKQVLYPHAFVVAAAIMRNGGDSSIKEIMEKTGEAERLQAQSCHQILRHLRAKGYVGNSTDENRKFGDRVRWALTEDGERILAETAKYYYFAVELYVGSETGGVGDEE